jgi:hypothetical protein
MDLKLLEEHLTPAEGEQVVKTYHCTTLDPMLLQIGSRINGHITVTNKRLVYFAQGYSGFGARGSSRESIELPIADVCNIAQTTGTRFDIIRLIYGIITGFLVGALAAGVMGFMNLKLMASFGADSAAPRLLILLDVTLATFLMGRSLLLPCIRLTRIIFAAAGASILYSLLLIIFLLGVPVGYFLAGRALGLVVAIYLLWCLYWFVRMNYITIAISSKGGMVYPIRITGFSLWSRINVAAWDAANMAPAVDADRMFRELGALVTDIQTLGDHGIKKWSGRTAEVVSEAAAAAKDFVERKPLVQRCAFGFIVLCAITIATEGGVDAHRRHQMELRVAAIKSRQEVDQARNNANLDQFARNAAPQLITKAEQEQSAGDTAFDQKDYTQASDHWAGAANEFSKISEAVKPFRDAEVLRRGYASQLQELISIAFNQSAKSGEPSSDDMARLGSYLENHAPEEWILVKDAVRKAEALKAAGLGSDYLNQWTQISRVLAPAVTKKVRAGLSLKAK